LCGGCRYDPSRARSSASNVPSTSASRSQRWCPVWIVQLARKQDARVGTFTVEAHRARGCGEVVETFDDVNTGLRLCACASTSVCSYSRSKFAAHRVRGRSFRWSSQACRRRWQALGASQAHVSRRRRWAESVRQGRLRPRRQKCMEGFGLQRSGASRFALGCSRHFGFVERRLCSRRGFGKWSLGWHGRKALVAFRRACDRKCSAGPESA
jgi:hypothetical protein